MALSPTEANQDYPVPLEACKVYRVLPDPQAILHHMIRVIDESEEGDLYPNRYFTIVERAESLKQVLTSMN
ncbi:MAG: hypothetical protein J7641_10470 [Cyanobacteria bacterium SID2]|nr:hypothetical protein [Cyanobacteria bacterium SID2]MBP0002509.1 hypothetical protein [Cyanobacteria bacterium SBC]